MIKNFLPTLALIVALFLGGCGGPSATSAAHGKKAIITLSKQGASDSEMIAAIEKNQGPFALNENDVIELHKEGVPDTVVIAMLRHGQRQ